MRTEVIVVLDRSGSMEAVKADTIGGFNNFIEEQRQPPGEARLTLIQFDYSYEVLQEGVPLAEAALLNNVTYQPRGPTALLDAIGKTIAEQGARFSRMPVGAQPEKVIVAIITDGFENASHQYSRQQVFSLISRQRAEWAWDFYFIGANQDAIDEAGRLGIGANQALTYAANALGTKGMAASLGRAVASSREGAVYAYSSYDRESSLGLTKEE